MMITRRNFISGGGVILSLPFLESIGQAQEQPPVYTVFVRQGNGVTQGDSNGESDRFWPYNPGPIDAQTLASQTDRVLSILAPWADKMIAIKGLNYGCNTYISWARCSVCWYGKKPNGISTEQSSF